MPTKILERPDEAAFHKQQVELEDKIDECHKQIVRYFSSYSIQAELKEKFNEKKQSLYGDNSGRGEMTKEMREINQQLQEVIRDKKDIYA